MIKFVILAVLLAASTAHAFWTPCGGSATTHEVYSSVCDSERCHVTRGQPLIANTTLTFAEAHHTLTIRVRTILAGIQITLPLQPPDNNACLRIYTNGSVFHGCPVVVGTRYNWVMEVAVPQNIPAFANNIVYTELLDHNNVVVSCSRLVATVV